MGNKVEMTLSYEKYKNLLDTNKQLLTACESAKELILDITYNKEDFNKGEPVLRKLQEAIRKAKGEAK